MNGDSPEAKEIIPQVTVVAADGRRIGVRVLPFRCTPILVMLDLDDHPWIFSRGNMPSTSNAWVRTVADFKADHPDYDWDTPRYREICIEGGLDPDHHRPRFQDQHALAGKALVQALCRHSEWPDHGAVNLVFDLVDVLRIDPWRGRTDAETLRQTIRFDGENRPDSVEQALGMVRRALGDDADDVIRLLAPTTAS